MGVLRSAEESSSSEIFSRLRSPVFISVMEVSVLEAVFLLEAELLLRVMGTSCVYQVESTIKLKVD